jgi:hypothetical protein
MRHLWSRCGQRALRAASLCDVPHLRHGTARAGCDLLHGSLLRVAQPLRHRQRHVQGGLHSHKSSSIAEPYTAPKRDTHRAGGRASTRQAEQFQFDHGAQFLRVGPQQRGTEAAEAPAEVLEQVQRWTQAGVVSCAR